MLLGLDLNLDGQILRMMTYQFATVHVKLQAHLSLGMSKPWLKLGVVFQAELGFAHSIV